MIVLFNLTGSRPWTSCKRSTGHTRGPMLRCCWNNGWCRRWGREKNWEKMGKEPNKQEKEMHKPGFVGKGCELSVTLDTLNVWDQSSSKTYIFLIFWRKCECLSVKDHCQSPILLWVDARVLLRCSVQCLVPLTVLTVHFSTKADRIPYFKSFQFLNERKTEWATRVVPKNEWMNLWTSSL